MPRCEDPARVPEGGGGPRKRPVSIRRHLGAGEPEFLRFFEKTVRAVGGTPNLPVPLPPPPPPPLQLQNFYNAPKETRSTETNTVPHWALVGGQVPLPSHNMSSNSTGTRRWPCSAASVSMEDDVSFLNMGNLALQINNFFFETMPII